jgi:outer membrane protein assembly factor BamB
MPRLGPRPGQVWQRFFVRTPEAIVAYDGPTAERLWESAVKTKNEVDLLLARDDLAVFATPSEVFALNSHTGSKAWSVGRPRDHLADPGADWEQGGAYRTHAVHDDALISARDDGKIAAVSLSTGELRWRQEYRPAAFGKICMTDPWAFYYIVQDGRVVVCVLDADTGSWLGSIATEESRPVEDLFATVDGRAILVSSRTIRAFDLASRTEVWQLPLAGQVRPSALAIGWDGLYFSDSGLEVQKVRLDDGTLLWTSERVAERGVDDLVVALADETLLASTSTSVTGLDAQTGLRLWEGTTPPRPRFEYRLPVDSYLLAIDSAGDMRDEPSMAYFYDHRSGVIPKQGGGLELGRLGRLKSVLAVEGGLLIETPEALRAYGQSRQ